MAPEGDRERGALQSWAGDLHTHLCYPPPPLFPLEAAPASSASVSGMLVTGHF